MGCVANIAKVIPMGDMITKAIPGLDLVKQFADAIKDPASFLKDPKKLLGVALKLAPNLIPGGPVAAALTGGLFGKSKGDLSQILGALKNGGNGVEGLPPELLKKFLPFLS